jgi:hypothetical protein
LIEAAVFSMISPIWFSLTTRSGGHIDPVTGSPQDDERRLSDRNDPIASAPFDR